MRSTDTFKAHEDELKDLYETNPKGFLKAIDVLRKKHKNGRVQSNGRED